ncbi:MAG: hypothetical protein NWE98_06205 [Candidatus Bathyarchaeota archaeon]|nr:hypothetical protein [Candidatus Bathyarchaeota archaeon]
MKAKGIRRGYPVAVLIGIEQDHASIWRIYSQAAKCQQTIPINGDRKDSKARYNFHEAIVDAFRQTIKEGVKSILIASPAKTSFAQEFQDHILAHHAWLMQGANKATFSQINASASTPAQVAALTRTAAFKELVQETAAQETENLLEILEKRLCQADNLVLFSLQEAESLILNSQAPGKPQPEYLLLTDAYLSSSRQKNRLHRLMQIAQNKKVKTHVVNAESSAGSRLTQLGGIVCLAKNS